MFGKVLTWFLLALGCNLVIRILLLLDLNKEVYNHMPGPCNPIPQITDGADDIELLKDGSVIISTGLRDLNQSELSTAKGKLYWYDLNATEFMMPIALELKILNAPFKLEEFNPHGLSAWSSKGRTLVYVVNHRRDEDTIESFSFDKPAKTLTYLKTIRDPHIYSATDVLAVGPDRVFITNSHYFKFLPLRWLERILMLNLGSLLFYDGKQANVVDRWVLSPTGIAQSKDKKFLYVASPYDESIRVYKQKPDNSIERHLDVSLLTSPENLYVDPESGDMWAGCHPIAHKYLRHLENPKTMQSPSQILRIRMQEKHESWTITEPFANDGRMMSGSSVGVFFNRRLLIGSMHDKLLACEVTGDPQHV